MLPGKRAAGGEVVVDESLIKRTKIDSVISSAAATTTAADSNSTGTSLTAANMGGGNISNGTSNGKLGIGGEGKPSDIDEDLHSRQLAVYGRETMRRLFASNILVSGMQGLGAEIAKNLILAGVKSVILHDEGTVELWDLSSNFIFTEDDLGKNRALASVQKLQELNNAVAISTLTTKLTKEQLSEFQTVVSTDISMEDAIEFDDFCHKT